MITARDVAGRLGISVSTVGRALADDPRISAETKRKVRRVAEQLGYAGNLPARMMRGGSSNLIGLVLPDVRNDFYAAIAHALSDCCDRQNYRVVLSITGDDRETEMRHIRQLTAARVAGIVIAPSPSLRRETRALLKSVPHVQLLRHREDLGGAWFGIDDEAALATATRHILALGHRRIVYIGGAQTLSTGAARVRGVRRAFAAAGADMKGLELHLGDVTCEAGEAAARALLGRRGDGRPTAIVSGSVHVTLGILQALKALGTPVPEGLSVVGFGDPVWYAWWGPGLTTVRPPAQSLATACGQWFLDQLSARAPGAPMPAHSAAAAADFIVRGSTARLPRGK